MQPPTEALVARAPAIDWSRGFPRHWNGDDAVATHAFNALSFLFPRGERFFIDTAREVAATLDLRDDPQLQQGLSGFVAQESVHSHQHQHYNDVLQQQGYRNVSEPLLIRLQERGQRHFTPLTRLALVCAYEHYTAILGNFVLGNPQVLARAPADLALVWGWHCAEETEHKAVCFDLYRRAGGRWWRRVLGFGLVTINFLLLFGRLYLHMLHHDGCLRPRALPRTAWRLLHFFFGLHGVGWHLIAGALRYLGPRFHPWDQDNRAKLHHWLAANSARLRPIGPDRAP